MYTCVVHVIYIHNNNYYVYVLCTCTVQIIIAGEMDSSDTKAMLNIVHSFFLPNKILIVHEPGSESFLTKHLPILSSMSKVAGKATAYVCENFVCSAPVNDPEVLRKRLNPFKTGV